MFIKHYIMIKLVLGCKVGLILENYSVTHHMNRIKEKKNMIT